MGSIDGQVVTLPTTATFAKPLVHVLNEVYAVEEAHIELSNHLSGDDYTDLIYRISDSRDVRDPFGISSIREARSPFEGVGERGHAMVCLYLIDADQRKYLLHADCISRYNIGESERDAIVRKAGAVLDAIQIACRIAELVKP